MGNQSPKIKLKYNSMTTQLNFISLWDFCSITTVYSRRN